MTRLKWVFNSRYGKMTIRNHFVKTCKLIFRPQRYHYHHNFNRNYGLNFLRSDDGDDGVNYARSDDGDSYARTDDSDDSVNYARSNYDHNYFRSRDMFFYNFFHSQNSDHSSSNNNGHNGAYGNYLVRLVSVRLLTNLSHPCIDKKRRK